MKLNGFSKDEISHHWKRLIDLGSRFLGTSNEVDARNYILESLLHSAARVEEQEFFYPDWSLIQPPHLQITHPSPYTLKCEAFINSRPTPPEGISGKVEYAGVHRVLGAFDWPKFAVLNPQGDVCAYLSGRLDGPAQPQPLDPASAPVPHFIIGEYDLQLLCSMLERQLSVEVQGTLLSKTNGLASSKNVIASFNPNTLNSRICLCAHLDSVYNSPGANDNASSVAALLSMARRMTEEKWDAPIDFCFFSGEEWNLIGSRAYVASLEAGQKTSAIKMVLNLDSISEGSAIELWAGPESFEEQLLKTARSFSMPLNKKISGRFPPPVSSDHFPFYEKGVPACMIFGGPSVKYHALGDVYCPEGVDNILFAADLTWYLVNEFTNREVPWKSWQIKK